MVDDFSFTIGLNEILIGLFVSAGVFVRRCGLIQTR
jgi:hypothetical protein